MNLKTYKVTFRSNAFGEFSRFFVRPPTRLQAAHFLVLERDRGIFRGTPTATRKALDYAIRALQGGRVAQLFTGEPNDEGKYVVQFAGSTVLEISAIAYEVYDNTKGDEDEFLRPGEQVRINEEAYTEIEYKNDSRGILESVSTIREATVR